MTDFHFIRPFWLLGFIPAIAWLIFLLKYKFSGQHWHKLCDDELLPYILENKPQQSTKSQLISWFLVVTLILLALAGPTNQRQKTPAFRNDSALVIGLDLSASMDASDIKPSRLAKARYKLIDILRKRKTGQTALIVYAGDAFIVTPLTDDTNTIISLVPALTTDLMPQSGINTPIAIQKAMELLKQSGLLRGDILLITDEIKNTINTDDYRLSILGVGTKQGAPIKMNNGEFMKDSAGNIVVPALNKNQLAKIAKANNGIYQTITNNDTDIERLSAYFAVKIQSDRKLRNLSVNHWQELGVWLLPLILILSAAYFRRGILLIGWLFLLPIPDQSYAGFWQTDNQKAQQYFKQQDYQNAAKYFSDNSWQAAAQYRLGKYNKVIEILNDKSDKSADDFYMLANALAKTGQLSQAIKNYQQALKIKPDDKDYLHNKNEVEKLLKSQKKQSGKSSDKPNNNQNKESQNKKSQNNKTQQNNGQSDKSEQQKNNNKQQKSKQNSKDKKLEQSDIKNKQQAKQSSKQSDQEKSKDDMEQANKADKNQALQQSDRKSDQDIESQEDRQRNKQLLKSIPDNPAELLRRKFKYQYNHQKYFTH